MINIFQKQNSEEIIELKKYYKNVRQCKLCNKYYGTEGKWDNGHCPHCIKSIKIRKQEIQDLDWENYLQILKEESKQLASDSVKPKTTIVGYCKFHNHRFKLSIYPSCPLCAAEKMMKDNIGLINLKRGKK